MSFGITIGHNDVAQQMAFSSSDAVHGSRCRVDLSSANREALQAELQKDDSARSVEGAVSLPALHAAAQAAGITRTCGLQTTASQLTVVFANLGVSQTISAPQSAVAHQGQC